MFALPVLLLGQLVEALPNAAAVVGLASLPHITLHSGRNKHVVEIKSRLQKRQEPHLEEEQDVSFLGHHTNEGRSMIVPRRLERGDHQVLRV